MRRGSVTCMTFGNNNDFIVYLPQPARLQFCLLTAPLRTTVIQAQCMYCNNMYVSDLLCFYKERKVLQWEKANCMLPILQEKSCCPQISSLYLVPELPLPEVIIASCKRGSCSVCSSRSCASWNDCKNRSWLLSSKIHHTVNTCCDVYFDIYWCNFRAPTQ